MKPDTEFRRLMFRGKGSRTFYGRINEISGEDGGNDGTARVKISIMSLKMFRMDLELLRGGNPEEVPRSDDEQSEYRPYLYEFEGTLTDEKQRRAAEELGSNWTRVYFRKRNVEADDPLLWIEGTQIISFSPLHLKGRQLVFVGKDPAKNADVIREYEAEKNEWIEKLSKDNAARNILSLPVFPSAVKGMEITVFNVGMGNCVKMDINLGGKNAVWWFDIGRTLHAADLSPKVKRNLNNLQAETVDGVILSHWDLDHIAAVGYFNSKELFGRSAEWIVPDLALVTKPSASAVRLCAYVQKSSILRIVNDPGKSVCRANSGLELLQGKGTGKGGSKNNNIGLLIRYKDALLTGDCAYEAMPDVLKLKNCGFRYLVAPHHGSDATVPDIRGKNGAEAYFSTGGNHNSKAYPGKNHTKKLKMLGFLKQKNTRRDGNICFSV